jgi:hypothetical protein
VPVLLPWLLLARVAQASTIETDLAELPMAGTDDWDRAVRFRLLVEYDRNGSHWLERREVASIPCTVWNELDMAIAREGRWKGLIETYGFARDLTWAGHVLGIRESARARAEATLRACGVTDDGPLGGPHDRAPDHELAANLLGEVPQAGSQQWEELVQVVLVHTYDLDGDGRIGIDPEVDRIDCSVWHVLDQRLLNDSRNGLLASYGFLPDRTFVGDRLGLQATVRRAVLEAGIRCGLEGVPPQPAPARDPGKVHSDIAAVPSGGSRAWDASVRAILLQVFDTDASGAIDRSEELEAIPCDVWQQMDADVRRAGTYSGLLAPYGLDGSGDTVWVGQALGFGDSVKGAVGGRAKACGLK